MAKVSGTVRSDVRFGRRIEGLPSPLYTDDRMSHMGDYGPSGEPGYVDGIDDVDERFYAVLDLIAAPVDLDLEALIDPVVGPMTFALVRYFKFVNLSLDPDVDVLISPYGASEWIGWLGTGSSLRLPPSTAANEGKVEIGGPNTGGYPVGGAYGGVLRLDPGAETCQVAVLIVGIQV
jgi:hypothetical protein